MPQDFTEKKIQSKLVYQGRLLRVEEDVVLLPDGNESRREYVRHPGASMIIPLFDDDTVLLERQYRYPVGKHLIEFPAGKLDSEESPLEAAQRELLEETGYVADSWTELGSFLLAVGYSDERIYCFLARGLTYRKPNLDQGEFLETIRVPNQELFDWIDNGTLEDSKTIIGASWLKSKI